MKDLLPKVPKDKTEILPWYLFHKRHNSGFNKFIWNSSNTFFYYSVPQKITAIFTDKWNQIGPYHI